MGRSPRKKIRGLALYLSALLAMAFFRLLPHRIALRIGAVIGRVVFFLDGRHRKRCLEHLRIAFGQEKSDAELMGIAQRSYENLGRSAAEFARISWYTQKNVAGYVTIEGLEHVERARRQGRGILFLAAHIGNWELLAVAYALLKEPIYVVARPFDDPPLNNLVIRMRSHGGNRILGKKGVATGIFSLLKKGEGVGILLDQNARPEVGVFVPFFERLACTNKGLALIALKSGAPVIPAFIIREGRERHRIIFEKEVELIRTGRWSDDIRANTEQFTRVIESYVRRYPDQWVWVHKRWRTRPPHEQES